MFFFRVKSEVMEQRDFIELIASRGIRLAELGHGRIRIVVHQHHTLADIDETLSAMKEVVARDCN